MASSSLSTSRIIGIGIACAASVTVGIGLVFRLVTPESVARIGTAEMLGLLGLLVLPAGVLAAARAHRAAAPGTPVPRLPAPPRAVVVIAPDLRDVSGVRHRHRLHPPAHVGRRQVNAAA